MINEFQGEYRFLSNFWLLDSPIVRDRIIYKTTEHYYVAMKTTDRNLRLQISFMKTGEAKKFGRELVTKILTRKSDKEGSRQYESNQGTYTSHRGFLQAYRQAAGHV